MSKNEWSVNEKAAQKVRQLLSKIEGVTLYELSIHRNGEAIFCIIRNGMQKMLAILPGEEELNLLGKEFDGKVVKLESGSSLFCELTHDHAGKIRSRFSFTRPSLIGIADSYGLGDRLGCAGPAHVRAVRESRFRPVLAQQSVRELERTGRTAEEVLDAATWAVFQEGYHEGFGADGDHLKSPDDIDRMAKAGYTMFTIDPSAFVVDEAHAMSPQECQNAFAELPWEVLEDSPDELINRFTGVPLELPGGSLPPPGREDLLRGMVKIGRVIAHTKQMSDYLSEAWPDHPAELELSVDETEEPTSLLEHYLVASGLDRLGVKLVSLAPRFCGDFEKGVDFRGDLKRFRTEYLQHLAIAEQFGGYKLSIHSGSDKFSVYRVIGSLNRGAVHVKTAGTSYLEALRTAAAASPEFFRELLAFSITRFEEDKKSYHISADVNRIPDPASLRADELSSLLDDDDARQVLHVAYGSILSGRIPEARTFRIRLMSLLEENESIHEEYLVRHFRKHLEPFGKSN